jgi:hypothetical protein
MNTKDKKPADDKELADYKKSLQVKAEEKDQDELIRKGYQGLFSLIQFDFKRRFHRKRGITALELTVLVGVVVVVIVVLKVVFGR